MATDVNGVAAGTVSASKKASQIQPHWWRKTFAGAVLGFTLTFALIGIFAWAGPGGISAPDKVQFNMWMVTPVWMLIFSLVYLFRTGNRALIFMLAFNLLAYAILFIVRGESG
ncbi:MAG: hypothetical protein KYX62_15105 [Pseudomonadota bacterium]|nr:hypothetical protein [Pseudomonadota bacterium]